MALAQQSEEAARAINGALRAGQYANAASLAAQALHDFPNDARILSMQGIAYSGLNDEEKALASFNAALHIAPDYLPALEGAAQIEYKAGSSRAIALLDRLLQLRPGEETAHAMRAVLAWAHRECPTAIEHFAASAHAIATQPLALQQYGTCLVRVGRVEEAAKVFHQLVTLDPQNRTAKLSLGAVALMASHPREALEAVRPLIGPEGAAPEALDIAASAYEAMGDTPQAVAFLRRAIVSSPRTEALYVHFASLSLVHDSFQVGVDVIDAGLKLMPGSGPLHSARGVLYVQLGRYDEADADFTAAQQSDAASTQGAGAKALAQMQRNDFTAARTTVRAELERTPNDEFLLYLLAEILTSGGAQPGSAEFKEAIGAAEHAVQLKPDSKLIRNQLSRLYLQAGDVDRSIAQSRAVLKDAPDDPTALYRLMRALQRKHREDDRAEIASLLKRFEKARELAARREADEGRYRMVEAGLPNAGPQQHP